MYVCTYISFLIYGGTIEASENHGLANHDREFFCHQGSVFTEKFVYVPVQSSPLLLTLASIQHSSVVLLLLYRRLFALHSLGVVCVFKCARRTVELDTTSRERERLDQSREERNKVRTIHRNPQRA